MVFIQELGKMRGGGGGGVSAFLAEISFGPQWPQMIHVFLWPLNF